MESATQTENPHQANPDGYDAANVVQLAAHNKRVPAATDAELEEYRSLLPRLKRMVEEWEAFRELDPLVRRITGQQE